jgi:streptomycin 6-kinase
MTSTSVGKHPTAFGATGLPILRIALDVSSMAPLLEPLIAPLADHLTPARLTYAKLLAYKKGNRGTIHYDVVTGSGRPVTVLGKLYPQSSQVARVYAILHHLYERTFRDQPNLRVPRPLGGLSDLSMLVYVPVEGTPLDEVLVGGDADDAIEWTAAWLAALHGAALGLDRSMRPETELVNLQAWASLVVRAHPEEGPRASRLAEELAASAGAARPAVETPIHKDFHYKHVLVDGEVGVDGGVGVIDFDEVRHGDPMYDVAHFCAHLRLLACRNTAKAASIAATEGGFIGSYVRRCGRPLGPSFPWYAAYTCLKIAKQLSTVRGVRPRPEGPEVLRQLTLMLDQGMAFRDLVR